MEKPGWERRHSEKTLAFGNEGQPIEQKETTPIARYYG